MSNRTTTRQSRAEARRRARLAAQGRTGDAALEDEDAPDEAPAPPAASGGLFQRLVPPAPPLRDKPDPLAGFAYDGPARPVVASLWLLAGHPISWLVPALIWMVAWPFSLGGGTNALIGSVAQYVALIGAGWIGWQRPWLFGVAAVLVGWGAVAWYFVLYGTRSGLISPNQALVALASQTALQLLVGFVAGWYGGYLRRRLADQRPRPAAARARRR
jgi:hypothetical protein